MKLTTEQVYNLVYTSLRESPEDWTYSDHYHKHIRGVGIPFTIENNEIGVSMWIANGASFCRITTLTKVEFNDTLGRVTINGGKQISGIGYFKRWRLYRAAQKMVIHNNDGSGWDLPVSKKVSRDNKIKEILS